jgi:hypothetical protein
MEALSVLEKITKMKIYLDTTMSLSIRFWEVTIDYNQFFSCSKLQFDSAGRKTELSGSGESYAFPMNQYQLRFVNTCIHILHKCQHIYINRRHS